MSQYENAPATKLVATHCACCGKALVDALSVDIGIGPICRGKWGFNKPCAEADWDSAMIALGKATESLLMSEGGAEAWANRDARKVCNVLVYHIAAEPSDGNTNSRISAIYSLGYHKLAAKLATVLGGVKVVHDSNPDYLLLTAPRTDNWYPMMRVPGQYWDRKRRVRVIPAASKGHLWLALVAMYPGKLCVGDKGIKILA